MAGVVSREIYGPLTSKQKEYLEIIQNKRYLLSLGMKFQNWEHWMKRFSHSMTSVDIEMLCQQALNILEEATGESKKFACRWNRTKSHLVLDKDKVRQLLYHLVFSVIQSANTGSVIHIHVSSGQRTKPCRFGFPSVLGDGLTQIDPYLPVVNASCLQY